MEGPATGKGEKLAVFGNRVVGLVDQELELRPGQETPALCNVNMGTKTKPKNIQGVSVLGPPTIF